MNTYIALLRGINVVGNHALPMKQLIQHFESLGCDNVRTYIQSGNVVFQSASKLSSRLCENIAKRIEQSHGFAPQVLILTAELVERAMRANPFPEGEAEPRSLHLFFLATKPKSPDLHSLDRLKTNTERFRLVDQVFYLHTPDGFGRSKLAARAERLLGVPATARNWRTVKTLVEMANGS